MFREFQDVLSAASTLRDLKGTSQDPMEMENLALRNLKLKRELNEPSDKEVQRLQMKQDQAKYIFSQLKDFALDNSLPESTRNHYAKMLEFHAYSLPEEYRKILQPLMANTPLDKNEQQKKFFDKFGPQEPKPPRTKEGDYLPITPENEKHWATYEIEKQEYDYKKNLFLFGKDFANVSKMPKFVQPLPHQGEGENRTPGDFWYRDPQTNEITNISSAISMISEKELTEKGWTMARVKSTGCIPAPGAETVMANYGGVKTQITPVINMKTGEQKFDIYHYGTPDDAIKAMPEDFLSALGIMAKETELEDISNDSVAYLVNTLRNFEDRYKGSKNLPTALNTLNREIQGLYPKGSNYRFVLGPDDYNNPWWKNMLRIQGTRWSVVPYTGTITVQDASGNPVTLYKDDRTGKTHDGSGRRTPKADGKKEGDTVSELTLTPTTELGEEAKANETVGTNLIKLTEYLNKPSGRTLRDMVRKEIIGEGEPVKITSEDLKKISKETGIAIEFLADFFFYAPFKEVLKLLKSSGQITEKVIKNLTDTILNIKTGD